MKTVLISVSFVAFVGNSEPQMVVSIRFLYGLKLARCTRSQASTAVLIEFVSTVELLPGSMMIKCSRSVHLFTGTVVVECVDVRVVVRVVVGVEVLVVLLVVVLVVVGVVVRVVVRVVVLVVVGVVE